MSQLRHLCAIGISLSSPGDKVLRNLQSVSGLIPSCCTKEIFEGIKKVKKLTIRGNKEEYPTDLKWIDNLNYLQDVESLSIAIRQMLFTMNRTRFFSLTSPDSFPQKLKKLLRRSRKNTSIWGGTNLKLLPSIQLSCSRHCQLMSQGLFKNNLSMLSTEFRHFTLQSPYEYDDETVGQHVLTTKLQLIESHKELSSLLVLWC
ncbi:hypothetical protein KY284_022233 [Solanum tuberosum]|nr:hypothetical protein KY284_022233 [Solanum tuberosum]